MAEEQSEKSFTVNDRRFSAQRESSQPSPTAAGGSPPSSEAQPRRDQSPPDASSTPPPEGVDFAALLMLLATQASMYLGTIPNPVTQKREKDLPAAKHFIDLLAILQIKTTGNLASEEERLLQQMLFDLRLHYVRETGR